jgi:hypothetical protein
VQLSHHFVGSFDALFVAVLVCCPVGSSVSCAVGLSVRWCMVCFLGVFFGLV